MSEFWEYEVQGFFNGEWECVTTETSRSEAETRLEEYRENDPFTAYQIRKVRPPLQGEDAY